MYRYSNLNVLVFNYVILLLLLSLCCTILYFVTVPKVSSLDNVNVFGGEIHPNTMVVYLMLTISFYVYCWVGIFPVLLFRIFCSCSSFSILYAFLKSFEWPHGDDLNLDLFRRHHNDVLKISFPLYLIQ